MMKATKIVREIRRMRDEKKALHEQAVREVEAIDRRRLHFAAQVNALETLLQYIATEGR